MTCNLYGLPKTCDTTVVIHFSETDKKYCISLDKIKAKKCHIIENVIKLDAGNKILNYYENTISYEQFGIIYKILSNCYITMTEFINNCAIIEYYCVDKKNILICQFDANNQIDKSQKIISFTFDDDIIINETEEQTKYFTEHVKKNKLQYMPFKVVFVEGTMTYDGDFSVDTPTASLKMVPVWMSLSEHNNILFKRKLISLDKYDEPLNDLLNSDDNIIELTFENSKWAEFLNSNNDSFVCEEEPAFKHHISELIYMTPQDEGDECDLYHGPHVLYNLTVSKKILSNKNIIDNILTQCSDNWIGIFNYHKASKNDIKYENYCIDSDGKMYIADDQRQKIIDRIKNIEFENFVKSKLNSTHFNFPQEKKSYTNHFCNESVYGNCTMLFITGFIKIE